MSTHSCTVHVTIFSTGSKFGQISNFKELHALTLAACSYICALAQINKTIGSYKPVHQTFVEGEKSGRRSGLIH